MITLSVCLTDLPEEAIQTGKNGKKYINLVVDKRKAESQYGETHTLYVSQTKEQREAKEDKIYVGGGMEYLFDQTKSNGDEHKKQNNNVQPKDNLPF